jgi:ubiquinone biosynthesis protein
MPDRDRMGRLFSALPLHLRQRITAAFVGGSAHDRVGAVKEALRKSGPKWRPDVGQWIAEMLSVEQLLPDVYRNWRPLVHEAMAFVASHISDERLAPKIVEQVDLPFDTPVEKRLGLIIAKTPGLQKIGQVLARTRRLNPALRAELQRLENGIADTTAPEIQSIIERDLGPSIAAYSVALGSDLLSEASVSSILPFTWLNPSTGNREEGVFKVLKPHVPMNYAEDLKLIQDLAAHLASKSREYGVRSREVVETLDEVRLLLEREVDLRREQATLAEVGRVYRRPDAHAPRPIPELCTDSITAMSLERGVKVTEALRKHPLQRRKVAAQIVSALIADPMFSPEPNALFHADPHAGNLFYDERRGQLIVLDWALTGRLSLEERRQLIRLMIMMSFRDAEGVREAIIALNRPVSSSQAKDMAIIRRSVGIFFDSLPFVSSPGALDAMELLDQIGLEGVRFPASLVLIRKVMFTLDGVLHDISGGGVRMDAIVAGEFVSRWVRAFGSVPSPLSLADYLAAQKSGLRYATGMWTRPA